MWLSIPLFILIAFGLIGGVLLGGVFTLVLVPLAVIVAVLAVGYGMWARASGANTTTDEGVIGEPRPSSSHANAVLTPTTPDQLVDARREQQ